MDLLVVAFHLDLGLHPLQGQRFSLNSQDLSQRYVHGYVLLVTVVDLRLRPVSESIANAAALRVRCAFIGSILQAGPVRAQRRRRILRWRQILMLAAIDKIWQTSLAGKLARS